jgi:F0F1-type ATP synthase delta subunit
MNAMLILQFLVLMFVVCGTIIFFLHRTLVSSTDGAVRRLTHETEEMRAKQKELNQKIKEANEELVKRKGEADELTRQMITDAEEKAKAEREEVLKRTRAEGEEIIAKAQGTKEKMRKALESELKIKTVDFTMEILTRILSDRARGALNNQLVKEFVEKLEKVEMSQIGSDINTVEVITVSPIDNAVKDKITDIIKKKLNREIKINASVDEKIIGGAILRFGSLALDGSLKEMIFEVGTELKKKVEDGLG